MGSRTSKSDEAGKPLEYDSSFNGPTKNRGCTDILCCFLFGVFFLAFIVVGIYAFAMGDPRLLIYPVDSDGHLCGSNENANKPFLLIFDLTKCVSLSGINVLRMCQESTQVCVESCPKEFWSYITDDINKAICRNNVEKPIRSKKELNNYVAEKKCAPFYMPSSPIIHRCFPTIPGFSNSGNVLRKNSSDSAIQISENSTLTLLTFNESMQAMNGMLGLQGYGTRILADVTATWWLILLFILLAMVISFVWIVLMRWIAGFMVWLSIFLFIGFFITAIAYCFHRYIEIKDKGESDKPFKFTTDVYYYGSLKETWLAIGIIASITLGIFLIILLFLIKRICIAVALIKETSRAIRSMMFMLLWPLLPFVLQIVVLVFWGSSAICLAAVSRTENCLYPYNDTTFVSEIQSIRCKLRGLMENIPCNGTNATFCDYLKNGIKDDRYTLALQAFQLFMWFWLMNFIVALGQITLAGSFSTYYWAFNKSKDIPTFPVAGSFFRAVRYHMGSMAFGSLLIAIVKIIIVLLEYLDHKLKDRANIVAKVIIKCCICCFWCLEKFLKFINKNAYIMIAVHGKNFCSSAMKAFNLILRNAIRVIVVDKVTDVLLFVNKLFIVGSVGVFAFFTFSRRIPGSESVVPDQLNYYFVPILIVIAGSYIVAAVFFSVYDIGVDTLFLCFLEDLERNDGSPGKPYYMSKSLMNILGKSNESPPPYSKVNNV